MTSGDVCRAYADSLRDAWGGHDVSAYLRWLSDVSPSVLADMIDRPTCNDVGDAWTFRCSACGCELDIRDMEAGEPTMWKDGAAQVPNYCPSCGAKVVMTGD